MIAPKFMLIYLKTIEDESLLWHFADKNHGVDVVTSIEKEEWKAMEELFKLMKNGKKLAEKLNEVARLLNGLDAKQEEMKLK